MHTDVLFGIAALLGLVAVMFLFVFDMADNGSYAESQESQLKEPRAEQSPVARFKKAA